jgi:nicotinamide-nucleotide amidase
MCFFTIPTLRSLSGWKKFIAMKAEIITIGDEILIGQVVDTNSAWMAQQLNLAGIEVHQITSVHDDRKHILVALEEAKQRADIVLITGGLGPTRDDITKNVLCDYFETTLIFHQPTFDTIQKMWFSKTGIPVNDLNRGQAMVPASCRVIPNRKGTAPGMWFEKNDTIFVSMPGVPFEMTDMMLSEILPRIKATGKTINILHKTILTQGIAESVLAERLSSWENILPSFVKMAYLPSPMGLRLRLSISGYDNEKMQSEINTALNSLLPLISDCWYGYDDESLAQVVGKLLMEKKCTLSVAESCTGGNISHLITLTPGSSKWFTGGITAYSNSVKTSVLKVASETLDEFGAVSSQTVREMAEGVRKLMKTDYSVATTGIAGPDGGSAEKPVGTIWICVAGSAKFICEKFVFGNDRERFIQRSSQTALHLLRKFILKD